ncbi:MAG TPA: thioredoxin-disulfide reductase [Planctomycetota bacterium]|nr:thioredoxin-disulfide reductase [Planctomycetota bacterium]
MSSSETNHPYHRVIILGSGPAGLTAALYAARADLAPLVLEGHQPGGQLTITTEVENFPGFPQGIMGPELMVMMREQAARFGTEMLSERITKVDFSRRPFRLWDSEDHETQADAVIVATGASAMLLGIPGEDQLMGYGVSACATCDAAFFRDVHVAVVGGGDSAMEEGNYLTKFAKKVTIIHRREEFRASKIMLHKAQHNPKVEFLLDTIVEEMLPQADKRRLRALKVRNVKTGEVSEMPVDGAFVAIGHKPNTELFKGQLELDAKGYVVLGEKTRTSVEGVFAAGDVADSWYRQAVTAAGTGCAAALDAERWLAGHG